MTKSPSTNIYTAYNTFYKLFIVLIESLHPMKNHGLIELPVQIIAINERCLQDVNKVWHI